MIVEAGLGLEILPTDEETGCLSRSNESVLESSGAGLSSEHIILKAALIFPSSILAETAAEREDASSNLRFTGTTWSRQLSELEELP